MKKLKKLMKLCIELDKKHAAVIGYEYSEHDKFHNIRLNNNDFKKGFKFSLYKSNTFLCEYEDYFLLLIFIEDLLK